MGKIIETKITDFSKGITSEIREKDYRCARMVKNFNAHDFSNKLVPLGSAVSGDADAATNKIQNFEIAKFGANDYRIFGLGVTGTKAKVFVAELGTDITWSALTNGVASAMTAVDFELFIYYAKTGRIYGAADGTTIWCVDPADAQSIDESDGGDQYAITLATAYENPRTNTDATKRPFIGGLVHSKDDVLYIFHDNIISSNDGSGDWTDPALTLPTNKRITSICEYGNYLAIATKTVGEIGNSVVYLWDRDSSLATLTESIDWGEGNLQILEQIEGGLIGISISATTATILKSKITFRYYSGGVPIIFRQLVSEDIYLSNNLPRTKRKVNNCLYFSMKIKFGGTTQEGIWKVGKNITTGQFTLSMDKGANNDTALTSGEIHGFHIIGDVTRIAYTDNGAVAMSAILFSAGYTANSTYESLIFNGDDSGKTKKLISVGVMTEPMVADGQIVLKYKKDADTSWTPIFTNTTNDDIYHESINIESSGATLPQFREIQFQILSTGNAVVTGLKFKYEIISKELSD